MSSTALRVSWQTAMRQTFKEASLVLAAVSMIAALNVSEARAQSTEAPIATAGVVYTANEFGGSLSRIDLATGEVETVAVSITPHNVQVTADGSILLAVGTPRAEGGHDDDGGDHGEGTKGVLLVFNAADLAAGPLTEIEVGEHPAHVISDNEGRYAYVANSEDDNVTVVDLASGAATGSIPAGAFPHGLRMSPNGDEIFVADVEDDSVSVLDPASLAEIARIPVGDAPVQVGFTPDGSRVYVSLRDENKVAVIDTATRTRIETVTVGSGPIQVHVTPDGRYVLVANQGTEAKPSDTVSVIDAASNTVVETIRTGAGAHGIAVGADGELAFVTNILDDTVSVIDISTLQVIATLTVGDGPNGITYSP